MFSGYSRADIVDAHAAHAMIEGNREAFDRVERKKPLRDLSDVGFYWRDETPYEILSHLEPSALAAYFGLVAKLQGTEKAEAVIEQHRRTLDPGGLIVVVTNSEDDPFRVNFHAYADFADDWADVHGSLDGGTWEGDDGTFIYDTGQWHKDLFAKLQKEGFRFDFSEWSDPEPEDFETAAHIQDCPDCQEHWSFTEARECMAGELEDVAKKRLKNERSERIEPWQG